MGAYLSQPNTVKTREDGGSQSLSYGFAAMQGWRVSMEDAHNCIPELDEETAMFAVYDGHGGEEVALYCSKYLPNIIKQQKTYKEGKLQKALEDAFLAIDGHITTEDVIKELAHIAGRPQEDALGVICCNLPHCVKALEDAFLAIDGHITTEDVIKELAHIAGRPQEDAVKDRVAEEDDLDKEEAALLHEEATMTIEELLTRYGQNMNSLKHGKKSCPASKEESGVDGKLHPEVGINGEAESEAAKGDHSSSSSSNGKEKPVSTESLASAAPSPANSKLRSCRRSGQGDKGAKSEGEAGPSCSSSSASAGDSQSGCKSKFFEDSDESEEAENESEEGGSEEEDCSEEDEDEYSSEAEEEDTEEDEEEVEEEEMCLPGMDGKEEPGSDSGTTAVVALIRGKQLIVANAGDSRCVVSEKGKAVDMSYDHKPEDELELSRIKNAGGKVTMDGRVNGGLNLSRAIGDHFYKRNKVLPPEEQMISPMPDVKVLTLNDDHDFMVIACDGIWNVMSSQEVVDFVSDRIKPNDNGSKKTLSSIVEELLDHCLAPDTSGDGTGCDNMTCIIITFSPHPGEECKKRKPEECSTEKNGNENKKAKSE